MFYLVRACSAFDHSYGKGATQYQMQYSIIIIIKMKVRCRRPRVQIPDEPQKIILLKNVLINPRGDKDCCLEELPTKEVLKVTYYCPE
jgi:hypothetical protein